MTNFTPVATGTGARARVQRGGAFLAGMIMPNLGAFIAWGLITALFIPTGWVNNIAHLAGMPAKDSTWASDTIGTIVGPIIVFLIPILIGYTGGRTVHGQRGAVVGAVATIGVVVSPLALHLTGPLTHTAAASLGDLGPQFLGALIIGPLAALFMKGIDHLLQGRARGGFEMLVDNFSAGIVAGISAIFGLLALGPVVFWISQGLGSLVQALINAKLLPLASILIEPAKVLFLNNAIGNGVLVPLAAQQAAHDASHSSILFMLESNPGPGLGILTAMLLFGPRAIRPTVPAAIVVQFLGGIHEIYFPYVLLKPILIIAAILGGGVGVLTFVIFGDGLVGPASPGSIFAYIAVSPPDKLLTILLGILLSAAVSFVVGAVLLRFGRGSDPVDAEADLEAAQEQSASNKRASKGQPASA
jgi:mannitol PTS system EIICBA or EIICB component